MRGGQSPRRVISRCAYALTSHIANLSSDRSSVRCAIVSRSAHSSAVAHRAPRQSGCDGCAAVRKCAAGRNRTTCDGCNHYLHVVCLGWSIPPVNPVADFTAATVLPIDRPTSVLSALRPHGDTRHRSKYSWRADRRQGVVPCAPANWRLRSDGASGSAAVRIAGSTSARSARRGASRRQAARAAGARRARSARSLARRRKHPAEGADRPRAIGQLDASASAGDRAGGACCRGGDRRSDRFARGVSTVDRSACGRRRSSGRPRSRSSWSCSAAVAAEGRRAQAARDAARAGTARAAGARTNRSSSCTSNFDAKPATMPGRRSAVAGRSAGGAAVDGRRLHAAGPGTAAGNAGDQPRARGQGALDHPARRHAADSDGVATGPRSARADRRHRAPRPRRAGRAIGRQPRRQLARQRRPPGRDSPVVDRVARRDSKRRACSTDIGAGSRSWCSRPTIAALVERQHRFDGPLVEARRERTRTARRCCSRTSRGGSCRSR